MATGETIQACLTTLKQNFGSALGHTAADGPGFAEMVSREFVKVSDEVALLAVDSLLGKDTNKLLLGHVRAAIETAREKTPQQQESFHTPGTYICPHCQDHGVQRVVVDALETTYDLIEPCPGYLGRPCPAGQEKARQISPVNDGNGRHVVARIPYHDVEACLNAHAVYDAQRPENADLKF